MGSVHAGQEAEALGTSRAQFLRTAEPLSATDMPEAVTCRICPERPAIGLPLVLCFRHRKRWLSHLKPHPGGGEADFERWPADQPSLPGYGQCRADGCTELAASPLGLCGAHARGYIRAGRPGGAKHPKHFFAAYERRVSIGYSVT